MLGVSFATIGKADPKEDLVKAIVDQWGLPKDKADQLATPGPTGTIVQFSICSASSIEIGEGCKVTCKKLGSNIGG